MRVVSTSILIGSLAVFAHLSAAELVLESEPSSSVIRAGDSLELTARVFIGEGAGGTEQPELAEQVTWRIEGPPDPLNPGLRNGSGPSATNAFYGRRAYQTYSVIATYAPAEGDAVSDTVEVQVTAGWFDHMVLEATDDSTRKLWEDTPLDLIVMGPGVMSYDSFYAVVRDTFGNWVRPNSEVNWYPEDSDIVEIWFGPNRDRGQGRITRKTTAGTPYGLAAVQVDCVLRDTTDSNDVYCRAMMDDLNLLLLETYYSDIRIGVKHDSEFHPVSHLEVEALIDTSLYAQGKRADNGEWEDFAAIWSLSAPDDTLWKAWHALGLSFESPTEGSVWASLPSGPDDERVTTRITFTVVPPRARTLTLYAQAGAPDDMIPLADTVTIDADDTLDLVAKAFNRDSVWLECYESADSLGSRISWTTNNATPLSTTGFATRIVPTVNGGACVVVATYTDADTTVTDSVVVVVRPVLHSRMAASRAAAGRGELRLGNQRIAVPSGARLARVEAFDMQGRRMVSRIVDLGEGNACAGVDLLEGNAARCCVAHVRFAGVDGTAGIQTRRLMVGRR